MRRPLALLLCALALGSCGGDGTPRAACETPTREKLDPTSAQHLLPGAKEPDYLSDPPTSGAHIVGNLPMGALAEPLPRTVQVALLEVGDVLVQYRDIDAAGRATLETLVTDLVVVAPNPDLPSEVVATAWLAKLECSRVDLDVLRGFIDAHRGKGSG